MEVGFSPNTRRLDPKVNIPWNVTNYSKLAGRDEKLRSVKELFWRGTKEGCFFAMW